MPRKTGRRPIHYVTSWGETIVGLSLRSNGRFYPTGKSNISFGSDERLGIHRFRQWQQTQDGDAEPFDPFEADSGRGSLVDNERQRIRTLLLNDPKQAALDLDIPHLAWYPAKPSKPTWTLEGIHAYYLDKKRNKRGQELAKKHKENSARWWKEFVAIVQLKHYRDLTSEHIETYHEKIMGRFDKGDGHPSYLSPDSVRHRFSKVKAVFNFGLQRARSDGEKQEIRRVLDLFLILSAPASESNPRPIDPKDFSKLLASAQIREQSLLLLGLNCLLHSGEATGTLKKDVDLAKGTFSQRRSKNGYPRVAKLWPRTIKSIRQYKQNGGHDSDLLFVSRNGTECNMQQLFWNLRLRAGVSKEITFESLRDAGFTLGSEIDPYHVKFVAGHRTGIADKYVFRKATNKNVVAICKGIEQHFFPRKKKPTKRKKSQQGKTTKTAAI